MFLLKWSLPIYNMGKLKTWQNPLKCISHTCNIDIMVATTVPTIYTRGNWTFFNLYRRRRNFFHCSETIHTAILSLLEIWGFTPTVRGTLGVSRWRKMEESPSQWGGLFWRQKRRGHPHSEGDFLGVRGTLEGDWGWQTPPPGNGQCTSLS